MDQVRRDLALAVRRLAASPAFTLFSIVTLALAIGVTTAIYSVVYAAVLKPLDIKDIDRVVNVYHTDLAFGSPALFGLSSPDYRDLAAMQTVFEEVTAWARFRQTIVGGGSGQVILGEMVGGEYFHLLGVQPALGRLIQPADDQPNAPRVIVLSDGLWRRQFAADPDIAGRTVHLNGQPFDVVGVAPVSFRGVDMPNVVPTAAWVPLAAADALNGRGMDYSGRAADREARWLMVKGRLRPGRTVAQAAAEMATIGRRLDLAYPIGRDLPPNRRIRPYVERAWFVMPAGALRMHESVHRGAGTLATAVLAAVGLVLLVACTNLANLLLARGASRRQEMAVRLALGASRGRLVREYLAEAALVAVAGGVTALAVARGLMVYVLSASMHAGPGLTVQFSPALHVSVFGAALAATVLALVVFGVVPALHLSRVSVGEALSVDNAAAGGPRWRARRNLIAAQVAVSVALVAVAAVAIEQIAAAARRDVGVDLDRLALVRLDFAMQHRDEDQARRTLEAVSALARRHPGVEAVAFSSGLPVGTSTPGAFVTADGRSMDQGVFAELLSSSPEILRTLGVPIVHGRAVDERDARGTLPVVVVGNLTARTLFGRSDVVGQRVLVQRRRWAGESEPPIETRTIVGVAADTDAGSVGRRTSGVLYVPFAQHYEPAMTIVARTSGDPSALAAALRQMTNRVDPELAIFDAGTGTVLGGAENLPLAVVAGTAGFLGLLALALAMAGLYGVLSHAVAGRTREIGLRMALGAGRGRLVRMVLADGVRPVVEGLAIGLGSAVVARFALRPVFVRLLPAIDPWLFLAVPIPFVVAALVACYLPARRAAGVDPNVALRHL